ncbi:MAG: response regulator, partial [Cyclobacteriaceae bacterium]
MKYRAIIVEDEPLSADRLHGMLSKQQNLQIEAVLNSVSETKNWLSENNIPDLLFLDIQLGDGTGLDILNELTSFPQVIFTTAF